MPCHSCPPDPNPNPTLRFGHCYHTTTFTDSCPDLTPVNEDELDEEIADDVPASQEDLEDEDGEEDDGIPTNMSQSRLSAYSGTTAKSNFSADAIAALDSDIMLEYLPTLDASVNVILSRLMPSDARARPFAWKDIATPGNKVHKIFKSNVSNYNMQKEYFVANGEDYIEPTIVLRALLQVESMDEVPDGTWRPDPILYKANLSKLLHALLIEVRDPLDTDGDAQRSLELAELWFAKSVAGNAWSNEAFDMSLAITTQLVMMNMASSADFTNADPAATAMNTFFEINDEIGTKDFRHFNALHMNQLSGEAAKSKTKEVSMRVNALRRPFAERDTATALGLLRAQFPWASFISELEAYYSHRKRQLHIEIANAGGVEQIVESLRHHLLAADEDKLARSFRASIDDASTGKEISNADIMALKAMGEADTASPQPRASAAQMTAPVYPELPPHVSDDAGFALLSDDDDRPDMAYATAQRGGGPSPASNGKGKAKSKSIMDRQAGAIRVSFDDSQSQQLPHRSSAFRLPYSSANLDPALREPHPGKRSYNMVEEESEQGDWLPTQDAGFAADARRLAQADERRRHMHRPQPVQRAEPQARRSTQGYEQGHENAAASSSNRPPESASSPPKRQRRNPGSSIPQPLLNTAVDPDAPEINPTQAYRDAKITSKTNRASTAQQGQARPRNPWTDQEEEALIDLIAENEDGGNLKYANLKFTDEQRDFPLLERRTAEDLRFKARNMKVTLLL
jgi:hypothetical protein